MKPAISARRVVVASFVVDLIDVVTNLVVMILTGSAVVFAELAAGVADSLGSALLVVGERRARRPRDADHPLGYSQEAFFWALLSAVAMLVIGAGLSAWRGWRQLVAPEPVESPALAVAVLSLAVVTNSYTVVLASRKLIGEAGSLREAFRNPGRPLVKNSLLRDAVGTFSSVLGLLAMILYVIADLVIFDALGALLVAAVTAASSIVLMAQARDLIIGQSVLVEDLERIRLYVNRVPEVEAVNHLAAVYAGTKEVLVELDLDLAEDLETPQIEQLLDRIENVVRAAVPDTLRVRIDLNSPPAATAEGRPSAPPVGRESSPRDDPPPS